MQNELVVLLNKQKHTIRETIEFMRWCNDCDGATEKMPSIDIDQIVFTWWPAFLS